MPRGRSPLQRILAELALLVVVCFSLALPRFFVPVGAIENWISDLFSVFSTSPETQNRDVVVLP